MTPTHDGAHAGRAARGAVVLLLWGACCWPTVRALPPCTDPDLRVGQALELRADPAAPHPGDVGSAVTVRCVPDASGSLTVLVESAYGDVLVRRLDESGAMLAEDDDGGLEQNARLVLDGSAGVPLRLLAAFKTPTRGPIRIEVLAGTVPLPTGAALSAESARILLARGLMLREAGNGADALKTLRKSGALAYNAGIFVPAQQSFEAALALAQELHDDASLPGVQILLGATLSKLGEPTEALVYLEQGLPGVRRTNQTNLCRLGESSLADCQRQLGHPAEALAAAQRALDLAQAAGDGANVAQLTGQVGDLQRELGDTTAARASHEQALKLAEASQDAGLLASELTLCGDFHAALHELREAEQLYQRALDLQPAPSPDQSARTLGQLANVRRDLGDYAGALQALHRALDHARDLGDPHLEALLLTTEGTTLQLLGDSAGAGKRLEHALDRLGPGGGNAAERTATLLQLAVVLEDLDDRANMLVVSMKLASIVESHPRPDVESNALLGLQHLHLALGAPEAARDDARRRLELALDAGDVHAQVGAFNDLADLELRLGDIAKAAEHARKALELSRQLGAPDVTALTTLAQVDLELKDVPGAEAALHEATQVLKGISPRALSAEQMSLWRSRESIAGLGDIAQDVLAARLAVASADDPGRDALIEAGFQDARQWKGRLLLQGIAEHRSGARTQQAMELRTAYERACSDHDGQMQRISEAVRAAAPPPDLEALRRGARQLRARADDLATQLRTVAPADAALDLPDESTSKQVRDTLLGDRALLIEFANGQRHLYAYVVDAKGLRIFDLGECADIDRRVAAFLDGMSDSDQLMSPALVATQGRELYARLLAPLLPSDLSQTATLIIVPTAGLAALPFEALVVEAPASPRDFSGVSFVLDRFAVVYGPSTLVLEALAEQPPRPKSGRMLLLADPICPAESAGVPRTPATADLPRLLGTRAEALALARMLLDHPQAGAPPLPEDEPARARLAALASQRSGSLDAPWLRLALGTDATPDVLAGDLRQYAVIHCAAHGLIDALDPRRSGLLLSPDPQGDNFLSVADVLDLDLDADLVVLSACDTGRGRARRGEGVQSVARAFLYAGARAVVASLWQVDDNETDATMRAFYAGRLQEGRAPAEALRKARLDVRHGLASDDAFRGGGRGDLVPGNRRPALDPPAPERVGHPYFWAPFVFIGVQGR